MRPGGRISALIELIGLVRKEWHSKGAPADRVVALYFRQRRFIGGGDRRWLGDGLYGLLRDWRFFSATLEAAGLDQSDRSFAIVWLWHIGEPLTAYFSPEDTYAPAPLTAEERSSYNAFENADISQIDNILAIKSNVPDEVFSLLEERFLSDMLPELRALQSPAPLDIRLNELSEISAPPKEGEPWEPLKMALNGYRAFGLPRLTDLAAFKAGGFEIQDEASQICAALVDAKPDMTVLDYCAGAGGKSLSLAASMKNKGRLIASDTVKRRLSRLDDRAARAQTSIIETLLLPGARAERSKSILPLKDKADRVLVDAPCSGSGVWRRNPAQKWHYGLGDIQDFHALQVEILSEAAHCVKPGGLLIYATCSLFPQENEESVLAFLKEQPEFELVPIEDQWGSVGLKPLTGANRSLQPSMLQLTPYSHDTDGFFIAILRRTP